MLIPIIIICDNGSLSGLIGSRGFLPIWVFHAKNLACRFSFDCLFTIVLVIVFGYPFGLDLVLNSDKKVAFRFGGFFINKWYQSEVVVLVPSSNHGG